MNHQRKTSFVTTVFNEQATIKKFLESLILQTKLPDEIIIVDGGSTDKTVEKIKIYDSRFKKKKIIFKVIVKKGNRSVGRNEAIKNTSGDIIVCSDAGNILDEDWIKNITKPFGDSQVDVVAGYYKAKTQNLFQKCLTPYVLVMPDKVHSNNFLPATRSVAFKKSIWKKVGGFDERFSHNEDYVFANKLQEKGAKIVFAKDAFVYWIPRSTYKEAFTMFFRFAFGDAEAGIHRPTVFLVFVRYFLALYFLFFSILYQSIIPPLLILLGLVCYFVWSIKKNYQYVADKRAITVLPRMQITADLAVLSGTILGNLKKIKVFPYGLFFKQNKTVLLIFIVYTVIWLSTSTYGIPNSYHPFPYNMDEWHQLQAVRATFKYGTPNVFGAANGTMLHFLLSGFYLIPFTLSHYINPAVLKVNDLLMRERIFELLRLNTFIFGSLAMVVMYKIAGILKVSKKISLALFTFTPIWLSLSGYFKYDIALVFWIVLAIYFFLKFWKNPTNNNFIITAIPSAMALSVKISALPLFVIYLFSYFWFIPSWKKSLKYFFIGIVTFIVTLLLFGAPDTLFGKGSIVLYFWENVIQAPASTSIYNLGMNSILYLYIRHYPMVFGHGFMLLFVASVLLWLILFMKDHGLKNRQKFKAELFIYFSFFMFIASLIPLQVTAAGNRSLVLLPFFVLIISFVIKKIMIFPKLKIVTLCLLSLILVIQLGESFAVLYMKVSQIPQSEASAWLKKNVVKDTVIGLENIPIYEGIPDILQKEFYYNQYNIKQKNMYTYQVIDAQTKNLPSVIVITGDELTLQFIKQSPKKTLLQRLQKEKYKKIAVFSPDLTYYKIFNKRKDFYFYSYLLASPLTTTVYEK